MTHVTPLTLDRKGDRCRVVSLLLSTVKVSVVIRDPGYLYTFLVAQQLNTWRWVCNLGISVYDFWSHFGQPYPQPPAETSAVAKEASIITKIS